MWVNTNATPKTRSLALKIHLSWLVKSKAIRKREGFCLQVATVLLPVQRASSMHLRVLLLCPCRGSMEREKLSLRQPGKPKDIFISGCHCILQIDTPHSCRATKSTGHHSKTTWVKKDQPVKHHTNSALNCLC